MDITAVLLGHPYLMLGPLVVLEGPITSLTAGVLVSAGVMPFGWAWLIVLTAEILADSALYNVGRLSRHWRSGPVLVRLGLTEQARLRWSRTASRSLGRLMLTIKTVDVLAVPALLAVGLAQVPYPRFLAWLIPFSAVRAAVLVGLGATLGSRLPPVALLAAGLVLAVLGLVVPPIVRRAKAAAPLKGTTT